MSYGYWDLVILHTLLFSTFLLFIPFRRKISTYPSSIYLAFIISLFTEMYGFPLTIYFLTSLFNYENPLTHNAGHLLPGIQHGTIGHTITEMMIGGGTLLIMIGWKKIYGSDNNLITDGIYGVIRHPQYLGIILVTLGFLIQWITIPTLIMWPILTFQYYKAAIAEEIELESKFGKAFQEYKRRVPMFIPQIRHLPFFIMILTLGFIMTRIILIITLIGNII